MKIITFTNQKGGVAKTTSTYNIAAAKAMQGKKVLMADLDPQASLTISCGMEKDYMGMNICGLLDGKDPLAETEMRLISKPAREKKLKRSLEKLSPYFDYCFIDCPPQLSILTINALVAADEIIIPCKTDFLAYKGLKALLSTIREIKNDPDLNPSVSVMGIIATIYEKKVNDQKDVWELLHEQGVPFIGTIKKSADTPRTVYQGLPVVISNKRSEVAQEYIRIAETIK